MTATTIKLEGALLKDIQECKPQSQSLAAYVREALEADVRRRRMALAAQEYRTFLSANPEEAEEMEQWAEAPLAATVKRRHP